jgi:ATP-dependent helicase/nuclease subunit A
MNEELKDQRARERFETELEMNFCVSAGAGVGKTTAIVRRVAALARREPEALARLAVVTYTRAAAEELRTRARTALVEEGGVGTGALLPLFGDVFFGTIHSFCMKLLGEHGGELALPPNADLLEREDEPALWARFCESPQLDKLQLNAEVVAVVTRFISFDQVLRLAEKIDSAQAERIIEEHVVEAQPPLDFRGALGDDGGRSKDATREHQRTLQRFLAEFAEGAAFLQMPEFEKGSGTFLAAYQNEMSPFAAWLGRQAARLAAEISLGFREYRREQGLMTYADQIAWCRALLKRPAIVEKLRRRDWIVLLDEAQDTDAAMFAILTEVTRPAGAEVGAWPDHSTALGPRAGRFCFVGDEQQAIYAQRANLAVYRKYIEAFAAGLCGERLEFSVTMRCPQRVIEAVNAIFFDQERLEQTHFAFRELHAKPECKEGAAWLLPIRPLGEGKAKVEVKFREECRQVGLFLKQRGPAGLGVESWREIAILCPRRAWLQLASEVFIEMGLPVRLISQKRLQLELPERSWPAALLHVLANPWDEFERIGVLREIFAVSDVELLEAKANVGVSARLAAADALLRELADAAPPAGGMSLGEYVEHVLERTCLRERLIAAGQRVDAVGHFRRDAIRAELEGVPFRQFVAARVNDLCKAAPEIGSVEDEMPLLTIQKAKGQEWPVVIPLGLARAILPKQTKYPCIEEDADEIRVHISKVTRPAEEAAERQLPTREENQRMFYVTLTRAKSLLILPDSLMLYGNQKQSFSELCKLEGSGWERLFENVSIQ